VIVVGQMRVAQVQLAFQPPARFVAQFPLAIQFVDPLPLRFQEQRLDLVVRAAGAPVLVVVGLTWWAPTFR
jgi:hypothetical protein